MRGDKRERKRERESGVRTSHFKKKYIPVVGLSGNSTYMETKRLPSHLLTMKCEQVGWEWLSEDLRKAEMFFYVKAYI